MRDPNRIDPILARLHAAWHRSPDLRLGQLIVGSIPISHLDRADAIRRLFNAECHEFGAAGAPVEWPAPSAATQPPPVLDLDALAEAERAMTAGPWSISTQNAGPDGVAPDEWTTWCEIDAPSEECVAQCATAGDSDEPNARAIVALRNAAPHLIAEARAAVALRQELAAMAEKLAMAKRLGLEAVKLSRDAIEAARMAPVNEPAATVVAIGCLNAADTIRATLEAL